MEQQGFSVRWARRWVSAGVVALAACGSDGGAAPPLDAERSFEAELLAALCQNMYACRESGNDLNTVRVLVNQEACRTAYARSLAPRFAALRAAAGAGRATFDAAEARRCVAAARAACLTSASAALQQCRGAYRGALRAGASCGLHEECADGYCHSESDCAGACRAVTPAGQRCSRDEECATAAGGRAECWGGDGGDPTCVVVRDLAPAPVGQPCGTVRGGPGLLDRTRCVSGAWCDNETGTGTCRAALPQGSACEGSGAVCEGNALCVRSSGGAARACNAVSLATAVGAECSESGPVFCDPAAGLYCQGGRCRRDSDGTAGSPCQSGMVLTPCVAGHFCDEATRTCQPLRAASMPCANDRECVSGACLSGQLSPEGRCAATYCE